MTRRSARLLLGALAIAALTTACSTSSSNGPGTCEGVQCGSSCCTADQECTAGACIPKCDTGIRCGSSLACCAEGEECYEGTTCMARCPSGVRCGANLDCCGVDEHCEATSGACEKNCTPSCTRQDGSAKECGDDGCGHTCGAGCKLAETCSDDGRCEVPIHTGNDKCDTARQLVFSGDVASEHGDTTAMASNLFVPTACVPGSTGSDVVYTLVLSDRKKVTATVVPDAGSGLVPVVDIVTTCNNGQSTVTCEAASAQGSAVTATVAVLPPGTYSLWVASTVTGAAGAGTFLLTVELAEPDQPPPANDTCAGAVALDVTSGHATVPVTLAYALNDTQQGDKANCGTSTTLLTGADVVYKVTVSQGQSLSAHVASPSTSTSQTLGVYIRSTCTLASADLACDSYYRSATARAKDLDAGTYFVFVDSAGLIMDELTLDIDVGQPPANDTCASPQTIVLDSSGAATATGNTIFASKNAQGSSNCSGDSLDEVFKLHIDGDKSLTLTVTSLTTGYQPIVFIRPVCEDPSSATERSLACGAATSSGAVATAHLNRVATGDYYVWVGGFNPTTSGSFTLAVTATAVPVPANDGCTTPIELQLDTNGKATVTGDTTYALDDYQALTCRTAQTNSPDLVYKLTLSDPASLTVKVSRDGTSTLNPAVYVRTSCATTNAADEKACATYSGTSYEATAVIPAAEATTYYIIVDANSYSSNVGPFKLEVTAGPLVANDTCSHPEAIQINQTTGIGTATGDTSLGKADDYGGCQTGSYNSSNDLVYAFTLGQEKAVTIDVTPATGSTLRPAIYVRSVCDDRASQVAGGCVAAPAVGPAQLVFPVLDAGTYFLWVDGYGTTAGAFTVTVTTTPPPAAPAGDTCATAKALTLTAVDTTTSKATLTGESTVNARNNTDGVGPCAGGVGGDLVYSVTLAGAQKITATVTPDTPTAFKPSVFIRGSCAGATDADQLACGAFPTGATAVAATATANSLGQGTWYIWVDGATTGTYKLEVTATTAVTGPANDNCSAPTALTFTGNAATVTGTTIDAQNDTRSAQNSYGSGGGDVVYTFTLATTEPRRITATATAATGAPSGFRPVVIVRNQCGGLVDLAAMQANPTPTPVSTTAIVAAANPGTYFVWVDTGGTTTVAPGPFSLTVSHETANDQCAGAIALTAGQAVNGSTANAVDQYGTSGGFSTVCATALGTVTDTDGPDVVYSYRPAVSGNLTVTVTPAATFDAIVWVTTTATSATCGDVTACVAAADAQGSGGVETFTVAVTGGRTYYIIVDSYQQAMSGGFSVEVH